MGEWTGAVIIENIIFRNVGAGCMASCLIVCMHKERVGASDLSERISGLPNVRDI